MENKGKFKNWKFAKWKSWRPKQEIEDWQYVLILITEAKKIIMPFTPLNFNIETFF